MGGLQCYTIHFEISKILQFKNHVFMNNIIIIIILGGEILLSSDQNKTGTHV